MSDQMVPITVAYGDGIGPEIMAATLEILKGAGARIAPEVIEIGEKVYLRGISTGIEPSAWESLRRTRVFLKAPITTPQGADTRARTSPRERRSVSSRMFGPASRTPRSSRRSIRTWTWSLFAKTRRTPTRVSSTGGLHQDGEPLQLRRTEGFFGSGLTRNRVIG